MKFTFKKSPLPTGLSLVCHTRQTYIKLNKFTVGYIRNEKPFKIRLQVIKKDIMEDDNPNCEWKWITLKQESETLEDAKKFLNNNIKTILTKYDLIKGKE